MASLARRSTGSENTNWWDSHPAAYIAIACVLGVIAVVLLWILWCDQRKRPFLPWRKKEDADDGAAPTEPSAHDPQAEPSSDPANWRDDKGTIAMPVRKSRMFPSKSMTGSSSDSFNLPQRTRSKGSSTASAASTPSAPPSYPFPQRPQSAAVPQRTPQISITAEQGFNPYHHRQSGAPVSPTSPISPVSPVSAASQLGYQAGALSGMYPNSHSAPRLSDLSVYSASPSVTSWAPQPPSSPPLQVQTVPSKQKSSHSLVPGPANPRRTSSVYLSTPSPLANVTTPNELEENPLDTAGRKLAGRQKSQNGDAGSPRLSNPTSPRPGLYRRPSAAEPYREPYRPSITHHNPSQHWEHAPPHPQPPPQSTQHATLYGNVPPRMGPLPPSAMIPPSSPPHHPMPMSPPPTHWPQYPTYPTAENGPLYGLDALEPPQVSPPLDLTHRPGPGPNRSPPRGHPNRSPPMQARGPRPQGHQRRPSRGLWFESEQPQSPTSPTRPHHHSPPQQHRPTPPSSPPKSMAAPAKPPTPVDTMGQAL